MTYLEQLQKLKTSTVGTVLTVKSPFDSFSSSDTAHFHKITAPFDSKDSSDSRGFQKTQSAKSPPPFKHGQASNDWLDVEMNRTEDGHGKQHKAEIINLLATVKPGGSTRATRPLPSWCREDCPGLETIPLPNEGDIAGCVHPVTGTWRRLDRMSGCPAMEKPTRPTIPSWCNTTHCESYHQADGMQWCCRETDERHWRRDRIDAMNECPMGGN